MDEHPAPFELPGTIDHGATTATSRTRYYPVIDAGSSAAPGAAPWAACRTRYYPVIGDGPSAPLRAARRTFHYPVMGVGSAAEPRLPTVAVITG